MSPKIEGKLLSWASAWGVPLGSVVVIVLASVIGASLWSTLQDHHELIAGFGMVMVALLAVEVSLSRRFVKHEAWETQNATRIAEGYKSQIDRAIAVADGIAASADSLTRAFRDNTQALERLRLEVENVKQHIERVDNRLRAVEERYMRPGLLPRP